MGKQTIEGLTLNQLAERNAEHVTAIGRLEAQVKQLAAENVALKDLARGWANATDDRLFEEHGEVFHDSIEDCEAELKTICLATDAILASLRAEAITDALENGSDYLDTDCVMDRHDISYQDAELRAAGAMELRDSLVAVANQLRSKSEVQS